MVDLDCVVELEGVDGDDGDLLGRVLAHFLNALFDDDLLLALEEVLDAENEAEEVGGNEAEEGPAEGEGDEVVVEVEGGELELEEHLEGAEEPEEGENARQALLHLLGLLEEPEGDHEDGEQEVHDDQKEGLAVESEVLQLGQVSRGQHAQQFVKSRVRLQLVLVAPEHLALLLVALSQVLPVHLLPDRRRRALVLVELVLLVEIHLLP